MTLRCTEKLHQHRLLRDWSALDIEDLFVSGNDTAAIHLQQDLNILQHIKVSPLSSLFIRSSSSSKILLESSDFSIS